MIRTVTKLRGKPQIFDPGLHHAGAKVNQINAKKCINQTATYKLLLQKVSNS